MHIGLVLLLWILVTGGRTMPGPPTPAAPLTPATVTIIDDDFTPGTVRVAVGDTVTWTNTGRHRHDVAGLRGEFRSERLLTGEQFEVTFAQPGTYYYQCTVHWSMAGTVLVTGAPP
jgi:plastocyanin